MTADPASIDGGGRLARLLVLLPPAVVLLVGVITPTAALHPDQNDIGLYLDKARQLVAGLVPYRDYPLEYPPGALIPMVAPYLAALSRSVDLEAYKVLFAGWEALLLLALGLVVERIGDRIGGRATALRLLVLTIGAALAITWRYDLFPALLAMLAVWAALERRLAVVGVALGVGALAKRYPVVLLPALALPWLMPLDLRGLLRLGAIFGLTVVLGLLPFVALAGDNAFAFLDYQVGRGLQIESIGGGLLLLLGLLSGKPTDLSFGFGAVQVEGVLAKDVLALLPVLTVVGFAALAWLGIRRLRDEGRPDATPNDGNETWLGVRATTLVSIAFASLLVLLVTSKVYSIQYVVWILPFLALLHGWPFRLGVAIAALTMPIHPILYADLVEQEALPILVLNLRNALVVALALRLFALTR